MTTQTHPITWAGPPEPTTISRGRTPRVDAGEYGELANVPLQGSVETPKLLREAMSPQIRLHISALPLPDSHPHALDERPSLGTAAARGSSGRMHDLLSKPSAPQGQDLQRDSDRPRSVRRYPAETERSQSSAKCREHNEAGSAAAALVAPRPLSPRRVEVHDISFRMNALTIAVRVRRWVTASERSPSCRAAERPDRRAPGLRALNARLPTEAKERLSFSGAALVTSYFRTGQSPFGAVFVADVLFA